MDQKLLACVEKYCLDLKQRGLKIATAESCTAGGLAYYLTHFAGSSAWFERGFVTYSNEAKIAMLNVSPDTLAKHGAVSEATAMEMAQGALANSLADLSIAVTGIAGPDGGSSDKPVGTVWIAWGKRHQATFAKAHHFQGDREAVRLATIAAAVAGFHSLE